MLVKGATGYITEIVMTKSDHVKVNVTGKEWIRAMPEICCLRNWKDDAQINTRHKITCQCYWKGDEYSIRKIITN